MKKLSFLVLAIMFGMSALAQDVTSAYNMNKAGEYDKAVMYIEKAITNPKDAQKEKTWRYRGDIYMNVARDPKFSPQFPNAVQLAKDSYFKALDIGGDYESEIKIKLSELQTIIIDEASKQFNANDFCNAANNFVSAREINDRYNILDSASIFNAAYCFDRCGKYEEALAGYKRCGEIGYNVPTVFLYMSDIYAKQGKKEESKMVLADARKKYPKNVELLRAEVNQLLEEQKYSEAETLLRSLTETDPSNESVWFVLGVTYEKLGKTVEMEEAYKKSIELNPKYFDGLFNLGASYYNKGVKTVNEECDKIPPREKAKYDDCMAKSKVDFTKSVEYLERAYEIQPTDKDIISALKEAYMRTDNAEGMQRMMDALKN